MCTKILVQKSKNLLNAEEQKEENSNILVIICHHQRQSLVTDILSLFSIHIKQISYIICPINVHWILLSTNKQVQDFFLPLKSFFNSDPSIDYQQNPLWYLL